MPKWLMAMLLVASLIVPAAAGAQGETKLDSIHIELWSEWDRPSMLVIYQFVVSEDTPLPAEVTVRFPTNGNLVAVAIEDNGELFNKDFTAPVEQGGWQIISVNVDSYAPHRIEYYQPLMIDGDKREFQYQWFGDYSVREFALNVLVPADSTGLVTSPVLENTAVVAGGLLTSGTLTRTDLRMGNSFQLEVEYERASAALVDPDQSDEVAPVQPVDENTPGRVSITNLPWIIGAFGLALIGIALFSYWRSTQSSTESEPRRRRRKAEDREDGQAYCHECGTRAQAGDRFCRTCGSRLRAE